MLIKKRIRLRNINYYIVCDCIYKNKEGFTELCLNNYQDDYYDGGDLSCLIEKLEDNYNEEIIKKYDGEIWFLSDCLYIYDNIPFISGIEDLYLSDDNIIYSTAYISKEELDNYIKENNIKMKNNSHFKLSDEETWLY